MIGLTIHSVFDYPNAFRISVLAYTSAYVIQIMLTTVRSHDAGIVGLGVGGLDLALEQRTHGIFNDIVPVAVPHDAEHADLVFSLEIRIVY